MEALKIVLLSVVGAVLYGIAHDQVTVRQCLEYFSVFHPPVFPTEDPTLLALGWGVIATWWAGAFLGVLLAVAARAGRRPKATARSLVRPVAVLLLVMGACAFAAWHLGAGLARSGAIFVGPAWAEDIPREGHVAFLGNLWAHNASYLVGFAGGVVLAVRTWRRRGRNAPAPDGVRVG